MIDEVRENRFMKTGRPEAAAEDPRNVVLTSGRQASMPENPVEHIWGYWKKPELPILCAKDLVELGSSGRPALGRMRRRPKPIECFWKQADVSPNFAFPPRVG
jgi:hypothetical protein